MEQKKQIKSLQQLIDWIDNDNSCYITEQDTDYFLVEAPNNADIYVRFDDDDEIENIMSKMIEILQDFDADERFMDLWSKDFAEHNHFSPSQFIRMLQEDEASFKELAYKLRNINN
jgi:hypothetical protein